MNILEVQDLCKTYGTGETEVHALNHVSFSVRKGEFIAIIGESGSGKSTLLNVVGALDSATSGRVWIDGQDIFSMPEKKLTVFRRQHIGFIFQPVCQQDRAAKRDRGPCHCPQDGQAPGRRDRPCRAG